MARFCPLFSGSDGNCTYIGTEFGGLLVDIGVSARRTEQALRERDIDPASIHTICLTHEHTDHVAGLKVFTKRYGCRVLASAGTMDELIAGGQLSCRTSAAVISDDGERVRDLFVRPFSTSHDSRQSCGYCICTEDDCRIAVATDTGYIPDTMSAALVGCDVVLIESNHDETMLRNGPYPYVLKQRILSEIGHLSNGSCAAYLPTLVRQGTTYVYLGHLSAQNNRPTLAYQAALQSLSEKGVTVGKDVCLSVASREGDSPVLYL